MAEFSFIFLSEIMQVAATCILQILFFPEMRRPTRGEGWYFVNSLFFFYKVKYNEGSVYSTQSM